MKQLIILFVLQVLCAFGRVSIPISENLPTGDIGRTVPLNGNAGTQVLYEVQVRTANACHPKAGSLAQQAFCRNKTSPFITYNAVGQQCGIINDLLQIKLGTLNDMLAPTTDYTQGITLSYIRNTVGATAVWLMPMFPNNDRWNLPDACDNLGSPYAVRDFFHIRGSLSAACSIANTTEDSNPPCYANQELDQVIAQARTLGLNVFLDLSFNHFGHNYKFFDVWNATTTRDWINSGKNWNDLWNFQTSYDPALLHPVILDDPLDLKSANYSDLQLLINRCPHVRGLDLVRLYNMWRNAYDYERAKFNCNATYLEEALFGFYLGANSWDPAKFYGDFFTNNWVDVKFLFHREDNAAHTFEFVRVREYMFRIMNYWVSRGVTGFRLDHTTDPNSGMAPNEWLYITTKVDYYAGLRGQPRPIYLAEEFHDQMAMGQVVDIETEGYVGDMCGRNGNTKDTSYVEGVLSNTNRFNHDTFVMTALETHDEKVNERFQYLLDAPKRLLDGTGFNIWTGAGFWGLGAAIWSTPMILMGQEFGEPWGLGFKRSDFIRSRFNGTSNYNPQGQSLVKFYASLIKARTDPANRALQSQSYAFLQTNQNTIDSRIFAQIKWMDTNVVFVFHNLWALPSVSQTYFIPPDVASAALINDNTNYKLVDVLSGSKVGNCILGSALKWSFYVELDGSSVLQWLRLEEC